MKLSKLCLGTVQLGMPYGINNAKGQPSPAEATKILRYAIKEGIFVFDTAPGYGDSEKILGQNLHLSKKLVCISKVPSLDWKNKEKITETINSVLEKTLYNLKIKKIPFYLFHRFDDLVNDKSFALHHVIKLKKQGLIGKIGISVYNPQEATASLKIKELQAVQIPTNLIDKRFIESGFLDEARKKKVTVLARSIFLQGLFFKKKIPAHLSAFKPYQKKIEKICTDHKISINELALRYVLGLKGVASVLIGLESLEQIKENVAAARHGPLDKTILNEINKMGSAPEEIINPSLWRKLKKSQSPPTISPIDKSKLI